MVYKDGIMNETYDYKDGKRLDSLDYCPNVEVLDYCLNVEVKTWN